MTRVFSRICPQFWIGTTGRKLRDAGPETLLVALYLLTNPHANMLGLYYLPLQYIAHETALSFEGACKGLQRAIEAEFCVYDKASEVVWVYEMARFQIEQQLDPKDNRCKAVQREYDSLPENPFLSRFYDKYASAFHLSRGREQTAVTNLMEGPLEGLSSQEQEQQSEQEQAQKQKQEQETGEGAVAPSDDGQSVDGVTGKKESANHSSVSSAKADRNSKKKT